MGDSGRVRMNDMHNNELDQKFVSDLLRGGNATAGRSCMRLVRGRALDMWNRLNGRPDKFFSHGVGVR